MAAPIPEEVAGESIGDLLKTLPGDTNLARSDTATHSPQKLKARHHVVLSLLLDGYSQQQIAEHTGYSANRVGQIIHSPLFQRLYRSILQKRYESIQNGDYGVVAMARAESPKLAQHLVGLAKKARNENTRRLAILDVLALAGHQPVTKTETLALDKLIEQFSDREMEVFANTGKWPRRMASTLRSLGRDVALDDNGEIEVEALPGPEDDVPEDEGDPDDLDDTPLTSDDDDE